MVLIAPPPPRTTPKPIFHTVKAGTRLVRLFDPTTKWNIQALTFNHYGPRHRFDHHRPAPSGSASPVQNDPERGIYYAAWSLSCCIMEVFGDYGIIDKEHPHIAVTTVIRPLRLLDLCGRGAMRAGSVTALCSTANRALSQAWSRYFYAEPVFRQCDGIRYHSAHNNQPAVALYERAEDALDCPASQVIPFNDPGLRPEILRIADQYGLIVQI